MSCDNLCTAAKCQELEERIGRLEQIVDLLQAALEAHVSQPIPQAHDYEEPEVSVSLAVGGNTLKVFVKVGDKNGSETIELPKYEPDVSVSLAVADNDLKVFVKVGEKSGDETITLPKYEPEVSVNLAVTDNDLKVEIGVGEKNGSETIALPKFEQPDWLDTIKDLIQDIIEQLIVDAIKDLLSKERLLISSDFNAGNRELEICVNYGDLSDCTTVRIPGSGGGGGGGSGGNDEDEELFLAGDAVFNKEENILTISINSSIGNASFQVKLMDDELLKQILDYTCTIYKILGGGVWTETGEGETKTVSLAVNPETKIKGFGAQLYTPNSSQLNGLTATNLLDLVNIYETVNYYRNGFHRLPAKTLKSLINSEENNEQITIYDAFSWQEYLIKQVDALIGEFPIKIKHQALDSSGGEVEQDIEINNISVAIAEILALNLGITHDVDTSINIGMKTLVEARNAANAAIVGVDYAKANAEYLGYKGNQKTREVDCTFTPKAKDLRKALKPSNQKIVGWENEDNETLIELIKKTLIGTEIIKAALIAGAFGRLAGTGLIWLAGIGVSVGLAFKFPVVASRVALAIAEEGGQEIRSALINLIIILPPQLPLQLV